MSCITPFVKKDKIAGVSQQFPCGKCPPCKKRRVSGWSWRLRKESERSQTSLFVTLTYDTNFVPISDKLFMTLSKDDLQKFFKRLRKFYPRNTIKYYAVGEYGGRTNRPHYHLILFNAQHGDVMKAWSLGSKAIGHVHFGQVNGASIGYTLKYMSKEGKIPMHRNDDRLPEFALMSKGLGANYMTPDMIKWHKADLLNRMYVSIEGGKKIAMPRYYKDKIYLESERERIAFFAKLESEKRLIEFEEYAYKKYGDDWHRVKAESDIMLFRKMYSDAEKGRTKI